MNLNCDLVSAISKSGNPYTCLVVHITDTCSKRVFLSDAEVELLKLYFGTDLKK